MKKLLTLYNFLFLLVILLAIFFRFYQLSSVPPAGSLDEVSIGWNAYSILLTGKGEYGRPFPIIMQAYDDFRPGGYLYLVIPFIKILGLSVLAVRMPSALLSLLTVVGSFFFSKIFLRGYKYEKWISLVVMTFFATSPFHIYISRLGHEVNPGLTFAFFGILFFLWGILSEKKWLMLGSGVFWAASFYTYQSEKVFVPLMVAALLVLFYKKVLENKKMVAMALLIAFVLSLPIVYLSFQPGALLRLKGTSVFTDPHPFIEASLHLAEAKQQHNMVGEFVYNRRLVPVSIFVWNYLPHFNPQWWVGNSGFEQFKAPGFGLSYMWELPLFVLGLVFIWRLPISLPLKILPIVWILMAFVAPGISTQTPHAMRSFNILPVPQLLEAIGFIELIILSGKVKLLGKILQAFFTILLLLAIGVSSTGYVHAYFVDFPREESAPYQFALHNAVRYVIEHQKEYNHIVVSNENNATQSYMFYLYESHYNPAIYLKNGGTKSGGFIATHHIGTIDFMPFNAQLKLEKNTLYIVNKNEVPTNVHIVQNFAGLAHIIRLVAFTVNS